MATFCDGIVQNIDRTECIGNSLVKINNNFTGLENAGCGLQNDIENLIITIQTMFVGTVSYFPSIAAPTGWLALSGQAVSRSTYSALWTFANSSGNIVTDAQWTSLRAYGAFSQGDGSSTFRLPDLRGHFVRGSGTHTDGTASGTFGVKQADDLRNHTHLINSSSVYTPNQNINGNFTDRVYDYANNTTGGRITSSTGGTETRPKNIALLACIKH